MEMEILMSEETAGEKIAKIRAGLANVSEEHHVHVHVNVEETKYTNGEIYDEDTGQQLGILADNLHEDNAEELTPIKTIPATLSVYLDGYWYEYKLDSRHKHEDTILKTEIDPVKVELVMPKKPVDKYGDL
jgi:hypothetical protein